MAILTRESLNKRIFSDAKNYPYGFSRSGDFSISESKALAQYGCLIAALVDGQIEPETEEDQNLLAAAFGKKEPEGATEKAWVKYQKRINRPKLGSFYGRHKPISVDDDDDSIEQDDLEVELDD
ncbi:DUF413 domain-containing protein [Paraglaciecola aestuariivivens]